MNINDLSIYSKCKLILGEDNWNKVLDECQRINDLQSFYDIVQVCFKNEEVPKYLYQLSELELLINQIESLLIDPLVETNKIVLNPTLTVFYSDWELTSIFKERRDGSIIIPKYKKQWIFVWRNIESGKIQIKEGLDKDLLAIKIVAENLDKNEVAVQTGLAMFDINEILKRSVKKGFLLNPPCKIKRWRKKRSIENSGKVVESEQLVRVFTLQWHITNKCDLKCKHCYIDDDAVDLSLNQSGKTIEALEKFCKERNVAGQINFTGGNPLLYPDFIEIYNRASRYDFAISIMGNPTSYSEIKRIADIRKPVYYQLSLEGLPEHNDAIRGKGNFEKVVEFLEILRKLKINCGIMLTLTKSNIWQVLPLANMLRNLVSSFSFCRLSKVGGGKNLDFPSQDDYIQFYDEYINASLDNDILRYKDNLLNITLLKMGEHLFGGCTGYGCGAAFNFVALFPNGDIHACRKFPSLIGNILDMDFTKIYDSQIARKYRAGNSVCSNCQIQYECGGCMANIYNNDLNVFTDKDPECFL